MIAAYHYHQGQIRPRVPLVKIIASAITLGTGGSGGREGPIAQIGAGFGSLLGNLLRLRPAERRVLMAAGMGAGIGAIFRARWPERSSPPKCSTARPEFEPEVIIPAGIASVISYCVFGAVFRLAAPVHDPRSHLQQSLAVGAVSAVGAVHGAAGGALHADVLRLQALLRPPADPPALPAGHRALSDRPGRRRPLLPRGQNQQVLAVLSFGYSAIQDAMTQDADVTAGILLAIALGKILTTGLTIGSGGSGGVFGPSMVIGGCGGGALGSCCTVSGRGWCPIRRVSSSWAWPASSPPPPRRPSPR